MAKTDWKAEAKSLKKKLRKKVEDRKIRSLPNFIVGMRASRSF